MRWLRRSRCSKRLMLGYASPRPDAATLLRYSSSTRTSTRRTRRLTRLRRFVALPPLSICRLCVPGRKLIQSGVAATARRAQHPRQEHVVAVLPLSGSFDCPAFTRRLRCALAFPLASRPCPRPPSRSSPSSSLRLLQHFRRASSTRKISPISLPLPIRLALFPVLQPIAFDSSRPIPSSKHRLLPLTCCIYEYPDVPVLYRSPSLTQSAAFRRSHGHDVSPRTLPASALPPTGDRTARPLATTTARVDVDTCASAHALAPPAFR